MSRINASVLWNYFEKISGTKKAICKFCREEYSFYSTTANLKGHLKHKHPDVYIELIEAQEQGKTPQDTSNDTGDGQIIYEYIVAASPASSATSEQGEESGAKNNTSTLSKSSKIESRETRRSFSERRHHPQRLTERAREKKLIDVLTEEKIRIALLQKDLVKKELNESNLRMQLIQEEMEHKKEMYASEREHKSEMYDLEKQEMLLKIEILKANLDNVKNKRSETD